MSKGRGTCGVQAAGVSDMVLQVSVDVGWGCRAVSKVLSVCCKASLLCVSMNVGWASGMSEQSSRC